MRKWLYVGTLVLVGVAAVVVFVGGREVQRILHR